LSLITLSSVSKHFGAEEVLDAVSFRIERGDHTALVGPNGAGKSTILRIIAGIEEPDRGTVGRARNTRVSYLPQEPEFKAAATLYEAMLDIFRDVIDAQERLRLLEHEMAGGDARNELVDEYGRLQALIERTGYNYREQIERVLTGLELGPDTWHIPVDNLSGGQRTRANLARTLLEDADVLLLDEPTNHLDIQAVEWLESYLQELKRAFVIVAHDRYLLDHVTRRTLDLSFHQVVEYDAPYSRYVELKTERLERQREEYEAQQKHIAKTEEFIRRYGAGQRYKEARGRQKQLDRLERLERPRDQEEVHLRLGRPKRSGDIVLVSERLVAGYPEKPLVRLADEVAVRRGERVAIVGPNGSGKTTLLRTLVGALPPLEGSLHWGANISIGYYSQTLEGLNVRRTVLEEVQHIRPMGEEEGRTYLGRFLFSADDVFKTISILSGGEKSRVALAKLILEEPNVLVLDEPTNHLDLASQDALQKVLEGFAGTILFVSHDRYLIDALAEQVWTVEEGRVVRYPGSYSDVVTGRVKPVDRPTGDTNDGTRERQLSPDARLRELEVEAVALAGRLAEIGSTTPVGQLTELMDRYGEVQALLEETEGEWLRSVRKQLPASLA